MPVKIALGLSKKIGLPGYSSVGASCHVECEVDSALLQEGADRFQAEAQRLFGFCREAVQVQLSREGSAVGPSGARTNGQAPAGNSTGDANGTASPANSTLRHHEEPAEIGLSERQLSFLQDLAVHIRGLGIRRLPALVAIQFDKNLTELTSTEASWLISALQQVRAGSLRLDSLMEQNQADT